MKFTFQNPFDNAVTRMNRAVKNLRTIKMQQDFQAKQTAEAEVKPEPVAVLKIPQSLEDSLLFMQAKVAAALKTMDGAIQRKKLQRLKVKEIRLQIKVAELEIGALFFRAQ